VFLQAGAHLLFSSVKKSFANDFSTLGGINIAGNHLSGAMRTEQVIALNPDVIIIAVMGSENGIGAEQKKHWLSGATIKAGPYKVMWWTPIWAAVPRPRLFPRLW
jgi:iron complex transport system substrate-binding protein